MKLDKEFFYYFSLLGHLGFVFIGNILFFIFVYKLYEKWYGMNTILFFVFLFLGIFSAFYNCYKLIMKR